MRGSCCYQAMSKLIIVKSMVGIIVCLCVLCNYINLLTPNVNYRGHTAPLTFKVAFYIFIQQI